MTGMDEPRPPFPEQSQPKPGLDARMQPPPRNQAPSLRGSGKLADKDVTDAELEEVFHANVLGYFYMAKAALDHLPSGGSIINCGSVVGFMGHPRLIGYAETNGAIHTLTKSLATSLIERGIRVNCVAPGPVWTPLNASSRTPEQMAGYGAQADPVPLGRPAQPEEIAPAFLFFASNADSSYVTGEALALFGGRVLAR